MKPIALTPLRVTVLIIAAVLCILMSGCRLFNGNQSPDPGSAPPFYGEPVTPGGQGPPTYGGGGAGEPVGAPGY